MTRTTAQTTNWADYAIANGFTEATRAGWGSHERWYDRGPARVHLDDTDIVVYRFTRDRARILEWQARFSAGTPAAVIEATIQSALHDGDGTYDAGSLGRVTIPED